MENVDVSLLKARATFSLKPGKELLPEGLRKAVVDAGFTPRDIFITARGNLKEMGGKLAFQPVSSSQVFSLAVNPEQGRLKSEGLKEAGVIAKVLGDKPPLSLEIQNFQK